ncbi:MAG: hypothetical protein JWM87_1795 [Candidatus Eremiobacteraeota bacterium]|nr:hypothetical protein [Candidatus Eremiobacteraeota bacterium]
MWYYVHTCEQAAPRPVAGTERASSHTNETWLFPILATFGAFESPNFADALVRVRTKGVES